MLFAFKGRFCPLLSRFEGSFSANYSTLLNQDVSHRFDVLVAIISTVSSLVATRVVVIKEPSSAKPDPGVATATHILIVSNDTNCRFGVVDIGT